MMVLMNFKTSWWQQPPKKGDKILINVIHVTINQGTKCDTLNSKYLFDVKWLSNYVNYKQMHTKNK